MKIASLSRPGEQRKVEKLLVKLATMKSSLAKPAPMSSGKNVLETA